jgi:hypothetical protein
VKGMKRGEKAVIPGTAYSIIAQLWKMLDMSRGF